MRSVARAFRGMVTSYKGQVVQSLQRGLPEFPLYRTVMPGWDNTARRQDGGTIFVGSSPQLFGYWVERMAAQTREQHTGDARLMFVNAWNEWGEGCHLEPDARYGRQYLQALAQGLRVQP
jgi:lipopolysaccharide biosynthesis protein